MENTIKIYGINYMKTTINNLKIIPEYVLHNCADNADQESMFQKCIYFGEIFRKVGLTPMYLCDVDKQKVYVTSKEKMNKQLH